MRDMMLAQGEFECSARLVRAYKRSKLEALRLSANATVTASDALAVWTKRYVERLRKAEDGKIGKGQLSEEMARSAADYNHLLQSYPLGAVALTHALIAAKQVPGKPSLAVTKRQREEILKLLTDYFGDAVKAGSQAGQEYTVGAAAVLYKFVADDRWYSAAE